jgi:hypothetical protein
MDENKLLFKTIRMLEISPTINGYRRRTFKIFRKIFGELNEY